ncbi:MAG: hypothetical protein Q4D38_13240 [Planctomycetia bacterium]|nr:hypothetical protein [Planctomycetia bacterium]
MNIRTILSLGISILTLVCAPNNLFSQTTPQAPIVPQEDGTTQRPLQAPWELTPQEQAQTDAVLSRWEQFSTGIKTFEADFTRILYVPSFERANQLDKRTEKGEVRYKAPDQGMFAVSSVSGEPQEKWLCNGEFVFEYKFSQSQIDQHTLPPEMRGKAITQGPLPFLFGSTAEELKRRYFIRYTPAPQNLARSGQVWIEACPKTAEDAAEFQRAEMIISYAPEVRPLAIKLHKTNREQHVYVFDMESMKVNKTQILPSFFVPSVPEKMKMKVVPVE